MVCLKDGEGRERGGHGGRQHKAGRDVLESIQGQFEGGGGIAMNIFHCVHESKSQRIKILTINN